MPLGDNKDTVFELVTDKKLVKHVRNNKLNQTFRDDLHFKTVLCRTRWSLWYCAEGQQSKDVRAESAPCWVILCTLVMVVTVITAWVANCTLVTVPVHICMSENCLHAWVDEDGILFLLSPPPHLLKWFQHQIRVDHKLFFIVLIITKLIIKKKTPHPNLCR